MPPAPPRRGLLHLGLFAATFVTLMIAGGSFWNPADVSRPLDLQEWVEILSEGLVFAILVSLILGSHEMGHYIACRLYGLQASLPYFIPSLPPLGTFGAVIRIRSRIPHRNALFDIAIAGPLAGFLLALPVLVIGYLIAEPAPQSLVEMDGIGIGPSVAEIGMVRLLGIKEPVLVNSFIGAGWIGMFVTSLNLFPVGQLDGGHIAYALSRRFHRITSLATLVALLGLIVTQLFWWQVVPGYVVWWALLVWMRDRHPPLLREYNPLSPGRRRLAWAAVGMFIIAFVPLPFVATLAELFG